MKVLVTGGTGFVGRHLVRALVDKQVFVRMLVRKGSDLEGFKTSFVEFVHGDITNRDSLRGIAKDIDFVFHLAAKGHVSSASKSALRKFLNVNVNGTRNVADECSTHNIKKFIHFSSTAAMGLIKKPLVDETVPCQPSTPYQKSKYEAEAVVRHYWKEKKLPAVILRPCMIYGPGGTGEFLKFCRLIKKGFFPKIGKGRNLTPIVHIKDVTQAAVLALHKAPPGETYLVTSHKSFNLDHITALISKYMPATKNQFYLPYPLALLASYCIQLLATLLRTTPPVTPQNIRSTVTDRVFDIQKPERELGYRPTVSIEQGIEETIKWYEHANLL